MAKKRRRMFGTICTFATSKYNFVTYVRDHKRIFERIRLSRNAFYCELHLVKNLCPEVKSSRSYFSPAKNFLKTTAHLKFWKSKDHWYTGIAKMAVTEIGHVCCICIRMQKYPIVSWQVSSNNPYGSAFPQDCSKNFTYHASSHLTKTIL